MPRPIQYKIRYGGQIPFSYSSYMFIVGRTIIGNRLWPYSVSYLNFALTLTRLSSFNAAHAYNIVRYETVKIWFAVLFLISKC
jgi:hypothetical protein